MSGKVVDWKKPVSSLRVLVLLTFVVFGSMLALATYVWNVKHDPVFFILFVLELSIVMSVVLPIWVKLYKKGRQQ